MSQRNPRISKSAANEKTMSNINNTYCNSYISDPDYNTNHHSDSENDVHYSTKKSAECGNESNSFMQLLAQNAAKNDLILSANGALEYASTGSPLTDFNARATEFRNADKTVIMDAATRAYAESPVDCVKLIFQTGDIRGGKGERHAFNTCMDWLVTTHPKVAAEVLYLIPEYTRWDYLVRHTIDSNKVVSEKATEIE